MVYNCIAGSEPIKRNALRTQGLRTSYICRAHLSLGVELALVSLQNARAFCQTDGLQQHTRYM